jgi:transposase InsO family protein
MQICETKNEGVREGKKMKRFQCTAIDGATRIRALKIYPRHNQVNTIDFTNHIIKKFPFRTHTIQMDNGHEWQAKFHWHCKDWGMRHLCIRPRTPRLNGKVERSHGADKTKFYQSISYKGDTDLEAKLNHWKTFYNFHHPHGVLQGKTPYEAFAKFFTLAALLFTAI